MRVRMFKKVVALVTLVAASTEAVRINTFGQLIPEESNTDLSQVSAEDGWHIILLGAGLYGGYKWGEKEVKLEADKEMAKKEQEILDAKRLDLERREIAL